MISYAIFTRIRDLIGMLFERFEWFLGHGYFLQDILFYPIFIILEAIACMAGSF